MSHRVSQPQLVAWDQQQQQQQQGSEHAVLCVCAAAMFTTVGYAVGLRAAVVTCNTNGFRVRVMQAKHDLTLNPKP